jgi:hypothetical protein
MANPPADFDRPTFRALIARADHAASNEEAWLCLEAAHIVGQLFFRPHMETHLLMLRRALRTGDVGESAGQIMRLTLALPGHLTGRLPLGNPGRATVNAFTALPVRPELAALIDEARAAAFSV